MDDAALTDALERGHLRGAMLEDLAVEPARPDARLPRPPNVTPTLWPPRRSAAGRPASRR